MRRQVLPTAPSPTTTHFMVCIMKDYLSRVNTCNRTNNILTTLIITTTTTTT